MGFFSPITRRVICDKLLSCLLYRANFNVREPAGLFNLELWHLADSSGWKAARVLELFFNHFRI